MMKKFPYLVLFSALLISFTGSFFSIYGLGKLFGGHQLGATIIAFAFEFGNIITATALKLYWDHLNKLLRYALVAVVVSLTVLTSTGIYGYLSDGYQKTALLDEVVTKRSNLVSIKKQSFETRIQDNKKEIESINTSVQELSKGFNQNTQTQNVIKGQVVTNVIVGNKKGLESQMNNLNRRKYALDSLNTMYLDSVQNLEIQIIELQSNNEAASELGPLKFLSDLSGTPMNQIVNWLILVIVVIFQPLAIMLLVTSMFAFENNEKILNVPVVVKTRKPRKKKVVAPEENLNEKVEPVVENTNTSTVSDSPVKRKLKSVKDKILSFNMTNLLKELQDETQKVEVDTSTVIAEESALPNGVPVRQKRKYTKRKPKVVEIAIESNETPVNQIAETQSIETVEVTNPVNEETVSQPDKKSRSGRKRKIVDTDLNRDIADHIFNSLQKTKKKV